MRRRKPPISAEYVEWEDHVSLADSGWKPIKDAEDLTPAICKSVGFVLKETSRHIILISTLDGGDHGDGEVCIIKSTIVKREKIWPK